ncbi:hypothetical protein T439DRAFT_369600 [Meredithblackwellia eburnea MCA 4105]
MLLSTASAILLCDLAFARPSYTLTSTNFSRTSWQRQPYVANGYIGQRIPLEGFGYSEVSPVNETDGTNGWPLFDKRFTAAMVAGFYDQQVNTTGTNFPQDGGEQPISTLPTWSSLYLTIDGDTYSTTTPTSSILNWSQSMSIQDGIVTTNLVWKPANSNSVLNLTYTLLAHRTLPNLGLVRLDVEGITLGTNFSITDALDGAGAWRTTPISSGVLPNQSNIIYSAVSPNGIANVTAYTTSLISIFTTPPLPFASSSSCRASISAQNVSTASKCYSHSLQSPAKISAIKYVGIASSDAFPGSEFETALRASRHGNATGWDALLDSHRRAWNSIWNQADIVIPDDDELQLAVRASLFHLISNAREGSEGKGLGDNSIAPSGLTSDSYAGQIFWDADTWMAPSLLSLFPSYAEVRALLLWAAKANAAQYNRSGALFPWTAGRFGNCTGVGPCYDYEYHLGNDIALAQFQYYAATGNNSWLKAKGWPVIEGVADFWASQVVHNASTGKYNTYNETDPDEYANFKNNAAYTNAGIQVILELAVELAKQIEVTPPSNWTSIARNITILDDPASNIVLEYDGFNGTTEVKQADVVLLTYPLEYKQSATQGLLDLDYYSLETSPSGPGMTYSIFSIDASTLSTVGCASFTHMLAASQPYSRAPFYQFSEQTNDNYGENGGTNPAFTFLTGHGGFLQSFTHGFTGHRFRTTTFYIDPVLPPQLQNYTVKGMTWRGNKFDVTVTTALTSISRRSGSGMATVEVAKANLKGGNYTIAVNQTLKVPTRQLNAALVPGNLGQCATVLSTDVKFDTSGSAVIPGQFSLAAVDGSNSTTWQPSTDAVSSMSLDLGSIKSVRGFHFNWGKVPPLSYTVYGGHAPANLSLLTSSSNVTISAPYNETDANLVSIKIGNLTNISLNSSVEVRFVNLTISGSHAGDGLGGTVAEFAIV